MPVDNLSSQIPDQLPEELFQTLLSAPHLRIERIVSQGHASPPDFWYDQPQDEWIVLIQGAARLAFEDETIDLRPGDYLNVAAHRRHRVEWTTPDGLTIWLAVHYDSAQPDSSESTKSAATR